MQKTRFLSSPVTRRAKNGRVRICCCLQPRRRNHRGLVPVDMAMAEKWSAKKAQALQEVEERFSQDTARILEGYDLPEHIRLDLHHRHCVEYKVPDDLRLKFMNPAFDGNLVLLEEGEIEALAREESDKFWIEMIARKRAAEKAQALRDIEERFNESILCSLDKKGIPEHIQEYYRHELKVPDDIHLNFVNDVEADFGILDHEDELRIKAWEELQRFRIETMDDKPAAKKLQALQHLEERFKRVIAKRLDRVDIHSENIRLFFQEYYQKVPDHRRLKYIIHLEDNWGILDHDRDLELRTWEESQQFQIKMMDDKLAVKKVQALKNMEDGYRQEIVDALDEYNFSENFKLELQEYYRQEYNIPDDFRLQFIHQIEGKFRMLDHQEELKVQIREEPDGYCQKFKMPRTKRSLVTVGIMLLIGTVILLASFLVPGMPKILQIVCWQTSMLIFCVSVLSVDHGNSKKSFPTSSPIEKPDLENPAPSY